MCGRWSRLHIPVDPFIETSQFGNKNAPATAGAGRSSVAKVSNENNNTGGQFWRSTWHDYTTYFSQPRSPAGIVLHIQKDQDQLGDSHQDNEIESAGENLLKDGEKSLQDIGKTHPHP